MFYFSVGLDAAGKTTILYKLKLGEIVTTIPTIGELTPSDLWLFPIFDSRFHNVKSLEKELVLKY